jgi:hypothetical protein
MDKTISFTIWTNKDGEIDASVKGGHGDIKLTKKELTYLVGLIRAHAHLIEIHGAI